MSKKNLSSLKKFFSPKISAKSFGVFVVCVMILLISPCLIFPFINMQYVHTQNDIHALNDIIETKEKMPVRLGMGFFVDGRYINRNRSDAMWQAEKFYLNDDGSFAITLRANYTAPEPSSIVGLEYVGSSFFMIVDAVYGADPFRVSRQRLSGLISVIANSLDSKSCIVEYQGDFSYPTETTYLRYLEVQFSWVRVFKDNCRFYFQWVQGNISDWEGENNKIYYDITGGFLACYPKPENEANSNLFYVDFGFNYVRWLKENL